MDGYNIYNIVLIAIFSIVILGIFLGAGKNRKIVVFRDYDDLGLTFLIPTSLFGIIFLFHLFGGNPLYGTVLASTVSFILFIILVKNSYIDNNRVIWKLFLVLITKLPLAFLWVVNLFSLIKPSGQTARQRRESRATAILILTIITPIIGILVVDKSGELFNPRQWIKGKRVGSIRNHM
ncbi:hypothetical protein [Acinetobacter piscicola]|uniref:hypothetical protein n=1 Tax=Acinetobacter piscicola TaxID=2006115 RepID=UPI000B7C6B5B|nr:hypothetical protein [Acinetobacter piscicola]